MVANNFASVKLTSGFVSEARREAEVLNRSLGGQIEHWAKLGRAIENAPGFSMERVREALEGRLHVEDLSYLEQNTLFEQLGAHFDNPSQSVRDRYAALGDAAGATGEDARGRLVRRLSDGNVEPVR
jgi:hypothetical protein